jgi:hypothetical protein
LQHVVLLAAQQSQPVDPAPYPLHCDAPIITK